MTSLGPLRALRDTQETASDAPSLRSQRRLEVSPAFLRNSKFAAGSWAILNDAEQSDGPYAIAQLWPDAMVPEDGAKISPEHANILAQASSIQLRSCDPLKERRKIAKSISVAPVVSQGTAELNTKRDVAWSIAMMKESFLEQRYLTPYTLATAKETTYSIVDVVESKLDAGASTDLASRMQGLDVSEATILKADERQIWIMNWKTQVKIQSSSAKDSSSSSVTPSNLPSYVNYFPPGPLASTSESFSAYASLGGLTKQIDQVRSLLDLPLSRPEIYDRFGLKPPRGILLYGPPGTGKTHLARAIASSTESCSCIVVNGPELSSAYHGETEERLRAIFTEAKKREPCVIVLDEIDALCPRREDGESGGVEKRVVATLLTLMDGIEERQGASHRVVVIAATNRPNAIDPALRRPGRFDREIEIGIPDAPARLEILSILASKLPTDVTRDQLRSIAERTHGYVGADLSSLVREAGSAAIKRWLAAGQAEDAEPQLTLQDLSTSLAAIRPSAMREVFIETPSVKWSDIGGQTVTKQKLKECVEWPLTHADTFKRLGVNPPKGVLLYGPPGCSKTLTAKALATESGINFMAVKGPELLNKFVGESERAVREVFRKARAASPSIVFFDEIDALATARGDGHDGPSAGVLTSLLNEMDGVEELSGVIVVAATNRPDVLDSALLRPGRLDRILYVGPPDLDARIDIFTIRFRSMAVEPGMDASELAVLTDGCSGAELVSICQDAALTAMNEDLAAPFVKRDHLIQAAKSVRKRITYDMIRYYERWRDQSGVRSA